MPRESRVHFFQQSSEMAKLLDAFDWEQTEIGSPEQWPMELYANVNLMLDTNVGMMIGWGADMHVIYNDGYIPIMQAKHPAIWWPASKLFEELWDLAGPLLEGVYYTGVPVKRENMYYPFLRRGFLEECYFTFSYSPIRSRDGEVVGILSTAIETTAEVLGARREELLQQIASPQITMSPEEAIRGACAKFGKTTDVPCHVALLSQNTGDTEVLSCAGVKVDKAALTEHLGAAEVQEALAREGVIRVAVSELAGIELFDEAAERCTHLAIAPLGASGATGHAPDGPGHLVLGLSSTLPWDPPHEAFIRRLAELVDHHYNAQLLRALSLQEAENRYRRLFIEALDGILLIRPSGEILAANPAACSLLGYSEQELELGGCELVRDPSDPRWNDFLDREHSIEEGDTYQGELCWLNRAGERIICEVSSSTNPEPHLAPHSERSTVILRDVTERLAMQAQLAEAQKMDVVGRVAGGLAHDFNNLLTVIGLQADILKEELQERPDLSEDIDILSQTGQRAEGLVRRLLEFTRQTRHEASVFDPAQVLSRLAPLLRRLAGDSVELAFDFHDRTPPLLLSPNRFEQIVMNLIVNARDAIHESRSGGSISIALMPSLTGQELVMRVTDDGIGIPEDKLERIFDPFYTTKTNGSGIGLSTVRMLVEGGSGSIEVLSEVGVQTTFIVRFPAHDAKKSALPEPRPSTTTRRLDDVRILLVEDQPHLRSLLERGLKRAGATVQVVSHGEEAMRALEEDVPDVLVSDVVMPLLSGPELVRWTQAHIPSLPAVLFSGHTGSEVVLIEELAPIEFLDKPFSLDALVGAIRRALESTGT